MSGYFNCKIHGNQNSAFASGKVIEFFIKDEPIQVKKYDLVIESISTIFYSEDKTALELGEISNGCIYSSHTLEHVDEKEFIRVICNGCLIDFIQKYSHLYSKY